MRVGVLALQGAIREHVVMLEALDVATVSVRLPDQLRDLDALIIPGGESTAIGKLMDSRGFFDAILARHEEGMAVWGTCAGAILVANQVIDAVEGQRSLELMDISVRRNAFGSQIDSFEADLDIRHVADGPFHGVFIRAPWIEDIGENVEVLATYGDVAVAARQGILLATAFHPELTGDPRMHRFFIEHVVGI